MLLYMYICMYIRMYVYMYLYMYMYIHVSFQIKDHFRLMRSMLEHSVTHNSTISQYFLKRI